MNVVKREDFVHKKDPCILMYSIERIICFLPKKESMHFPEDEYIQICKLVSDKINEFINVFKTTQLNHIISQKLNEISDVIMNCVEYPKQTFIVQELFLGCQILLLSNDIKMIQDVLRFLSLAIYSTDNLSESLSIFFPLIFNLNERNDIFVKRYFSFATNVFTDLKKIIILY